MTQISINYGIVLYELAISKEKIDEARGAIKNVPQLLAVLVDPTVECKKKHIIIERVFPKEMHNFLKQVCDYHEFDRIEEIFSAYDAYAAQQEGILSAVLYYVTPPTKEQQEKIRGFLMKKYPCKEVRLQLQEKPQLLGGFIIRVGNFEYDWSIRGRMQRLKQKLIRR